MTIRTSNRSISPVRTSDAVSDNTELCLIVRQIKNATPRTREMVMSDSLAAPQKAFGSNEKTNPNDQRFPENSSSVTLSP